MTLADEADGRPIPELRGSLPGSAALDALLSGADDPQQPSGVLHVVWEYPPVIYGGLARHVEHLARAQQDAGHAVSVVTAAEDVTDPSRRVPATSGTRRGITVHRVRRAAPRTPWADLPRAAAELGAALVAGGLASAAIARPDVVHGHDWTAFPAARAIADAVGVPLVMTIHATEHGRRAGHVGEEQDGGVPATIHRIEQASAGAADAVIVCSDAMRAEVVDVLGGDRDRVHVVRNAVNAAAWRCGPGAVRAARRHWTHTPGAAAPPPSELLVAAAGRIEWEKGFSTLVRAIPGLREAVVGTVHVVVAGRGSETARLEALATDLGVRDSLEFPGWLSRRDLAALYAAADAVVVPSRYEPSGLVAREAQAAGAAVVVTGTGGLAEAVRDGTTGVLIGIGDVHGLRDAVLRLAADPVGARAMGQAAAAGVKDWTWADAAAATEVVYREATAAQERSLTRTEHLVG
jgi:glycogen(starch) synthase